MAGRKPETPKDDRTPDTPHSEDDYNPVSMAGRRVKRPKEPIKDGC